MEYRNDDNCVFSHKNIKYRKQIEIRIYEFIRGCVHLAADSVIVIVYFVFIKLNFLKNKSSK